MEKIERIRRWRERGMIRKAGRRVCRKIEILSVQTIKWMIRVKKFRLVGAEIRICRNNLPSPGNPTPRMSLRASLSVNPNLR
jgi:hypothetical protein